MPRNVRFKIAAIADLHRQLDYAPAETRLRQMDATERLIADIDPQQNYPEDFIIFRITGYRPDRAEEAVTLVGEALVPDLANFVLLLSQGLKLAPDHANRTALTIAQAAKVLNISEKTLQRYRRKGLVCHCVYFGAEDARVACFHDALQNFVDRHQRQVARATGFARMNSATERAIIEQARHLHDSAYLSLNEAAKRLAKEHGRAHETVRQVLQRHDRGAKAPIFNDARPLNDRLIARIYRAWRFGVEPERIAKRYGKSKPTIHRAVNRQRADLLTATPIKFIALSTFELPEASSIILAAPVVMGGLDETVEDHDAFGFIAQNRADVPPDEAVEDALVAAFNLLKMQSAAGLASLGEFPKSEALDIVETNLRWTSQIQRKLLERSMPVAVERIEQNLHRPLTSQPSESISLLLQRAIGVCAKTIDQTDPSRGQRIGRMVRQAMDRSLARFKMPDTGRAAARHAGESLPLTPFLDRAVGFVWLSPPRAWRQRLTALDNRCRRALTLRFGWSDGPPRTVAAVAKIMRLSPIAVVGLLREGEVELRRAGGRHEPDRRPV